MRPRLNQLNFWLAVFAGLMLMTTNLFAQPPGKGGGGGGGGGGSTIGGTIYFHHAQTMWQMDGNGTPGSRMSLPNAPDYGDPSHALHDGERWFVFDFGWPWELHPAFPNGRSFAEIIAGDTAGNRVTLVSDISLEIISRPRWSRDDSSITFVAERWDLDANGVPYAFDAGLYRLLITFVDGFPIAGALQFVIDMSSELRTGPNGAYSNDQMEFCGHSWNANGTKFAFGVRFNNLPEYFREIWVVDTTLGTSSLLVSGNGVGWPEWSPDGSRIGYFSSGGTIVYTLATGNTKRLSSNARESWGLTIWSPSGVHFATYHWSNNLPGYDAIYRFTADVGGKTSLTQGMETLRHNVFRPMGWRD